MNSWQRILANAVTSSDVLMERLGLDANEGRVAVGDALNLEIDSQTQAIVDTVERVLDQRL